ncbi:MAG: hypothetical protein JXR51_03885 [Bacteroidales bacterium]|nr:hypothetical protein [Bacteroidales bacterium]MBN2756295.1 hypothetical protein [Bacteroidales bacterium]
MKNKHILSYLFVLISSLVFSQENQSTTNIFISPRITIGYTFGSGMNYGVDLALNLYTIDKFNVGFDYSFYIVNTPTGFHRIKNINLMAENDMISVKLGAGMVKRKWGLKKINNAKTAGITIDVSVSVDPMSAPWVGVKSFVFQRSKWPFYDLPSYISVYTYYRTPEIYIYQQPVE